MNADRLLHVAREEVARLAAQGVAPEPRRGRVRVLGAPARAAFEVGLRHMRQGGVIAPHDERVAARLAWVMTGGDVAAPADVAMEHLFELERQAFLSLLGEPDTQVRIADLLTKRSPRLVRLAAKRFAGLAHVLGPARPTGAAAKP
jgi:3-hydroxyacyl-CoA dehydrogenase